MRLPHKVIENIGFSVENSHDLITGLASDCSEQEAVEIERLAKAGLPPVTSLNALAVMTGYNRGFLWSLLERSHKYYRIFEIPKGHIKRQIEAPRIALKAVQKWLSVHFERSWTPHNAVHGFVKTRSHITAAQIHLNAQWVVSVDIDNFFPSTSEHEVQVALKRLGYRSDESTLILSKLCCVFRRLSQGAPSSPVLSNIALHPFDQAIQALSERHNARFTRYADDIVLSGIGDAPVDLIDELSDIFNGSPWKLSDRKRVRVQLPLRLKVHGLLVHGCELRLTKGYRKRLRAYQHLWDKGLIDESDRRRISGHLNYAAQINAKKSPLNSGSQTEPKALNLL